MTASFSLPRVDDAVWPARGSTTGRAIESAGRRALFEALKAAARGGGSPSERALAESFGSRLPGSPHAISTLLDDPSIGALLRRGLAGDVEARFFDEGVRRLRVGLGDESAPAAAPPATLAPDLPYRRDPWLARAVGLPVTDAELVRAPDTDAESGPLEALATRATEAMVRLAERAPALHDERRRFLRAVVLGRPPEHGLHDASVGVVVLTPDATVDEILAAYGETFVRSKLRTLKTLRGAVEDLAALEAAAAAAVAARLGGRRASDRSPRFPPAFADVAHELGGLA